MMTKVRFLKSHRSASLVERGLRSPAFSCETFREPVILGKSSSSDEDLPRSNNFLENNVAECRNLV